MTSIRRSLFLSVAERYLGFILQLVLFFVLARLLTPEDIGLYSVAVALMSLAHVLRDFGVASYLIQETELTDERIRTAFTLTLGIALVIFLLLFSLSGIFADFYRDPRLADVLRVMSGTFLLIPFSSTALALLRRHMEFGKMFWISTASTLVSFVTALSVAAAGFGYWSLVWSGIASTLATALIAAWFAKGGFAHRPTLSAWRRVASFGAQSSAARIITEVAMSMNDLVVGRVLGFADVGILSRAQGVMNLMHRDLMGAIRNVAFPAFAKAHREGADMEHLHTRSTAMAVAIAWPFYGFFALYPLEALRLMFGPQWDAAAPLVPIFCAAGATATLWGFTLTTLTATGRIDLTMKAELVAQSFRIAILLICAFVFGTLTSFAYGLLIAYGIHLAVSYLFKHGSIPFKRQVYISMVGKSMLLAISSLVPAGLIWLATRFQLIDLNQLLLLLTASMLTALTWIACIFVLKHPIMDEPLFKKLSGRFIKYPNRSPRA